MEAKEKALRLCQDIAMTTFGEDFNEGTTLPLAITKKIAVICVDEILNEINQLSKPEYTIFVLDYDKIMRMDGYEKKDYWESVKEEINKL